MKSISIGSPAPDFRKPDQNETLISLSDFSGKWIVLYFYPKDNTPGCTLEAIDFTALKNEFDKENAEVIGVSADSVASHQKFCEKKALTIRLISDEDHSLLEMYGVWQKKKLYGREFMGIVRSTCLISPDRMIAEIWSPVKVENHALEVLNKLRTLKGNG